MHGWQSFKFKILSIHDLYKERIFKFVYQQRIGKLPQIFSKYFSSKNELNNYPNTRHRNHLILPKTKTESAKKSLKYTGVKIWNQMTNFIDLQINNTIFVKIKK